MAASLITVSPLEYDYPSPQSQANTHSLPSGLGLPLQVSSPNFVTLSDNTLSSGNDIEGFLYVPSLVTNSSCANTTKQYIPNQVTRLQNIPPASEFNIIAIGPWTTPACVLQYLDNGKQNGVKAFYTYLPMGSQIPKDQSYASGTPPPANDSAWDLGDGGEWMATYQFPVYALNSLSGTTLMNLLSNYSGTIDTVPNGVQLQSMYPPGASVRMYTLAQTSNAATLPSLWVFLLIVLGILIAVLLIASGAMRVVQRRRRRELQRMIANGEINLEALGVARIKVDDAVLSKMPICIYVPHGGTPGAPHAAPAESSTAEATPAPTTETGRLQQLLNRKKKAPATTATQLPAVLEEKPALFPQESCPICLDDYEEHVTPVRWLPCSHIFHPACIDPLLREYSSLCPICKASVLPKDYIPEVTNVMVRRERLNRRFQDIERRERERVSAQPDMPIHFGGIGRFVRVTNENAPQTPNEAARQALATQPQAVEMHSIQPAGSSTLRPERLSRNQSNISGADAPRRPENVSREEWARQRAADLIGTSETVEEAEQREEARRPLWRRALGPIFPNLR